LKPYIQRNIALTQQAYNLHQITVKPVFPGQSQIPLAMLTRSRRLVGRI
jgi:uncharacterized membrane protein (UPF0182 family)